MELNADLIRVGRAALGWSTDDLARASGLGVATVYRVLQHLESRSRKPPEFLAGHLDRLKQVFRENGVTFEAVRGGWSMTVKGRG